MRIPDVLGMELNGAKTILEAEGVDFTVVETKPTKLEPVDGILRVIRVKPKLQPQPIISRSAGLVLTVCKI